jgi:hypothetical protein
MKKTTKKDVVEVKFNSEQYLAERNAETAALVNAFNTKFPDSVVYLKLTEGIAESFQIHFRLDDQFVDSKIYDRGNAIIYPSEAVYREIERLAPRKVSWNNTASIGWLNY